MKKVIFIYIQGKDINFPEESSEDYWIAGHTGMISMQLAKRYDSFVFESWRIDKNVNRYKQKIGFGVLCKVFSCITLPFIGPISLNIFRHIYKERKKNKITIHVSSASNLIFYLVRFFFRDIQFIYSQMGERLYFLDKNNKTIKLRLKYYLQNLFLKSVDHFFVASNIIYEGLVKLNIDMNKISFPEIGTDINLFYPMDKKTAREKLRLPLENKIALYIGRYTKERGVDAIINSIDELKSLYPDLLILMLGGQESDPYWNEITKHKEILKYGYTKYELLPFFHNAADLSVRLDFSEKGPVSVGTNVFESLCCNTPVVSTTLKHFQQANVKKLGINPKSENEVIKSIIHVLENSSEYQNCSKQVRAIYSWEYVCAEHIRVYHKLFENKSI